MPVPVWKALFLACLAVVTWLSLAPLEQLPRVDLWDKASHVIAYLVLGILMALAWPTVAIFLLLAILLVYGLSTEIAQSFLAYRQFSLLDLLADLIGALPGVLIARRFS